MKTPKSSEVLSSCHELFPGLTWTIVQDSDDLAVQYQKYSARILRWDVEFELMVGIDGSMAWCGFHRLRLIQSLNEGGQTYQQALFGIKLAWVEYCEAMVSVMDSHENPQF